jgi:O-antigen/teichoic acid export membrane protein
VAVGKPEEVARVRLVQLIVMLLGLFTLGLWLGIIGVALTIDLMLVLGTFVLLKKARAHVDFSTRKLLRTPVAGLSLAYPVAYIAGSMSQNIENDDWLTIVVKSTVYFIFYVLIFYIFERKQIRDFIKTARKYR